MPKLLNKLERNKQKTQFLTVYRRFQKGMERGVWSVGRGAWSVGRGAWGVERGAWSVGRGAWGVERGACHCPCSVVAVGY